MLDGVCAQGVFLLVLLPQSRYSICLCKPQALMYLTSQNLSISVRLAQSIQTISTGTKPCTYGVQNSSCLIHASHSPGATPYAPFYQPYLDISSEQTKHLPLPLARPGCVPHSTGLSLVMHSPDLQEGTSPTPV